MEFIIADSGRMEIGYLKVSRTLDMDIGGTNDLELTLSASDSADMGLDYGWMIFCPETEYGGILADKWSSTASSTVKWYADTWRGMLEKKVIEPPSGLAYRTVSGEANSVIRSMLSGLFGDVFLVPQVNSGITVNYQFARYTTLLEGLEAMLRTKGARLKIRAIQGGAEEPFYVQIEAVNITDYSEELEYSQDNKINLTIRDYRRGINHLICLGKGELTERMVLHLYVQADGSIGTTRYYTGEEERVATYDYGSADDETTLREDGKKRLKELMDYRTAEIDIDDISLEIGDIVAARDRVSGLYMQKPIVGKIIRSEGINETIEYKLEGEN